MRLRIFFSVSGPKAQKLTNSQMANVRPYTPLEPTPEGAMSPGKLKQKARMVSKLALDAKLNRLAPSRLSVKP